MRSLRALYAGPHFGLAIDNPAGRGWRLHRRMRVVRDVVLGLDLLVRACVSRGEVAVAAQDGASLPRGRLHLRAVSLGIVCPCGPSSHLIFSALRPWIAAQVLSAMIAIPPDGWNFIG